MAHETQREREARLKATEERETADRLAASREYALGQKRQETPAETAARLATPGVGPAVTHPAQETAIERDARLEYAGSNRITTPQEDARIASARPLADPNHPPPLSNPVSPTDPRNPLTATGETEQERQSRLATARGEGWDPRNPLHNQQSPAQPGETEQQRAARLGSGRGEFNPLNPADPLNPANPQYHPSNPARYDLAGNPLNPAVNPAMSNPPNPANLNPLNLNPVAPITLPATPYPAPPTPAQQIVTLNALVASKDVQLAKLAEVLAGYKNKLTEVTAELALSSKATGPQHLDAVVAWISKMRTELNKAVPGATW